MLGPKTNRTHQHAIASVKDEKLIKRNKDNNFGPRIGCVMRHISSDIPMSKVGKEVVNSIKQSLKTRNLENTRDPACCDAVKAKLKDISMQPSPPLSAYVELDQLYEKLLQSCAQSSKDFNVRAKKRIKTL